MSSRWCARSARAPCIGCGSRSRPSKSPANGYAGKFSTPYCIATAFVRGNVGLSDFSDAAVRDPAVVALAGKVRYRIDPQNPYPKNFTGHIRATLRDGTVVEERQPYMRGGAQEPLTRADIQDKFLLNATHGGWTAARAAQALKTHRDVVRRAGRACGVARLIVTFLLTWGVDYTIGIKSSPRKGRQPVTPTDGAGAVPAGGGSSLPLSGGPGIDPAGITTGARGASLKRDAKAQANACALHRVKRGPDRASAYGRSKCRGGAPRGERAPMSARPRPKRNWVATSDAWRGPTGQLRLPALRLPLFFWRQIIRGVLDKPRARMRRENEFAFAPLVGRLRRRIRSPGKNLEENEWPP